MTDPVAATRTRLLEFGGGGALGLSLGGLWQAWAATPNAAPVRNPIRACILVFYYGGPSHIDTLDLKPDAPAEVRGEFRPISTSAPGVRVCEHLPRLAREMHKVALVRSVTHAASLHDSAAIHALTGRPLDGPDRELFSPLPQFYPSHGSSVAALRPGPPAEVPFAALPFPFRNVHEVPCQGGGFLGPAFDPLRVECDPDNRGYRAETLRRAAGVDLTRLGDRRALLAALDRAAPGDPLRDQQERAYRLLDSDAVRRALEIEREPPAVRDRYGFGSGAVAVGEGGGGGNGAELGYARHMRGQNLLLARRLVEAGVPFVNVYDFRQQGQNWDAHFKGANQHKTYLLPQADQSLSALIEDLDDRGLLETTLVVAMGEFGRTPKINGEGGRDHWPHCYGAAGRRRSGGRAVYGSSDKIGVPVIRPGHARRPGGDDLLAVRDRPGAEVRDRAGDRTGWRPGSRSAACSASNCRRSRGEIECITAAGRIAGQARTPAGGGQSARTPTHGPVGVVAVPLSVPPDRRPAARPHVLLGQSARLPQCGEDRAPLGVHVSSDTVREPPGRGTSPDPQVERPGTDPNRPPVGTRARVPEADVVPRPGRGADRRLERHVLGAAEEVQVADRRGGVRTVERDAESDPQGRADGDGVGDGPPGCAERGEQFGPSADQDEVDRVARSAELRGGRRGKRCSREQSRWRRGSDDGQKATGEQWGHRDGSRAIPIGKTLQLARAGGPWKCTRCGSGWSYPSFPVTTATTRRVV